VVHHSLTMAHEVTPGVVRTTATLARVAVPEDAVAPLAEALARIVAHVAVLKASAGAPGAGAAVGAPSCPMRDDAVTAGVSMAEVEAMAPRVEVEGFVVPRFGEP
jgi:Asp-tRNA(Asn)/Glu-tRNA(Gln) amidotransferase C subunit